MPICKVNRRAKTADNPPAAKEVYQKKNKSSQRKGQATIKKLIELPAKFCAYTSVNLGDKIFLP